MALRSLVPFRNHSGLAPSDMGVFGSLHREIDRLFDDVTRNLGVAGPALTQMMPSMDVTESDKEIVVTAELPGARA